jgi:ubiquinone/menaquinone biosynthesis C-methylase UbiE
MESAESEFRKEVARLKPKKILNIACGVNLKPSFLKDVKAEFFGTDIDKKVISGKVKFSDIDKEPIPYPDSSFDLVMTVYSIEHFKTRKVFSEAHRVLKKNGKFIFITTNFANPLFLLTKFFKIRKYYYRYEVGFEELYPAYYNTNTPWEVAKALKKNGFEINEVLFFDRIKGYFKILKTFSELIGILENFFYVLFPEAQPTMYVVATKIK